MSKKHLSADVDARLTVLLGALVEWERSTGRQSMLILRENNGEGPSQPMTEPGFELRAMNGIPLGEMSADLTDDYLLKGFRYDPPAMPLPGLVPIALSDLFFNSDVQDAAELNTKRDAQDAALGLWVGWNRPRLLELADEFLQRIKDLKVGGLPTPDQLVDDFLARV